MSTSKYLIVFVLMCFSTFLLAQSKKPKSPLANLPGTWKGTLTYIDYSSGKPYTMPANIIVKPLKNSPNFLIENIYPDEPKANSIDTFYVSSDCKIMDDCEVKTITKLKNGQVKIVTQRIGVDGNDSKKGLIKQTYLLSKTKYSIKKEVLFDGKSTWLLRHQYNFEKLTIKN